MPAKNTEVMMFTCPSPPRRRPISAMDRSMSDLVTPPLFMSSPARMKSGIASSEKMLICENTFCGSTAR